jgi:phage gp29-like protein
VANVAPAPAASGPLHASAEAIRFLRQNKHNPLPHLKPEMLSGALDAFEHGRIREAVLLWEKMAERDDVLLSVKPKREKDVSQLDMQVVVEPDSGAEGDAHQEVLKRFWKTVRATNAYDRNERGKFRRLIKQMMSAISFRYAVHHIIWDPQADGELRATFEFVPLWLFENTTGKLRYLETSGATHGKDLTDGEWMVTTGDGLMIACSIGYLAKRSAFNDWLIFSEKFSVPGVLGRTSAAAGTPEAIAMEEATQAFGHDWCAVITGDDGTHDEPIKIIQAEGNPAGMPMPAVIERVDRRMAALYRGADLSSMSSGPSGEGTGASLQEQETDILRRDDAETIAETLEEISRLVIEWYFGNGVEPLARVELVVPVSEDATSVVTAAGTLADRGAKVSSSALMERLNLPEAADDADALRPAGGTSNADADGKQRFETKLKESLGQEDVANAMDNWALSEWLHDLRSALAKDLQPLGDALASAVQAGDLAAMQAALRKISKEMPDLAGDASAMSEVLAGQMTAALLGEGESEEVANGDFAGHPFRGNQHKGTSREGETAGWKDALGPLPEKNRFLSPEQNENRLRSAVSRCMTLRRDVPKAAFREGLGQVDLPYGRPGNPALDYQEGYGASHIVAKHGRAALDRVPAILSKGEIHKHEGDANKRYIVLDSDLVVMGRKDARHSWVISSFTDMKKTKRLNQGG